MTLRGGFSTIVNIAATDYAQNLTFEKLFMYYAAKKKKKKKYIFA